MSEKMVNFIENIIKRKLTEKESILWGNLKTLDNIDSCMSLYVDEKNQSVELLLDTSIATYAEWIPGEGGDISLIRCRETKKVVGVYLPLLRTNLCIGHTGPMCINTGFEKKK